MTSLRQALSDYLRVRRRLGFKLKADQRLLENFVGFLEQAGASRITTELALMWARLTSDVTLTVISSALMRPSARMSWRRRPSRKRGVPAGFVSIDRSFVARRYQHALVAPTIPSPHCTSRRRARG